MTVTVSGRQAALACVGLALALGVAAWWVEGRARALREAAAREEALRLDAEGALRLKAVLQAKAEELAATYAARNADLAAAVGELEERLGKLKPVTVTRYVTKPGEAGGTPRPPEPSPTPAGGGTSTCLLAAGDTGRIEVEAVTLETKLGNRVVAGAASAWRVTPAPETRLFGGRFDAKLSSAGTVDQPAKERPAWGLGVAGFVDSAGWAAGPAVSGSAWRLDGTIAIGLGPGGARAMASAIFR